MIFVTFVTLFFRRMKALISYSLKDIFEQVCYKCDKNYESDEGYTFFKDKKREVAYLQIRCILLILGSYKTFIEKTPIFEQKYRNLLRLSGINSCSSRGRSEDRPVRSIPFNGPLAGSRISLT